MRCVSFFATVAVFALPVHAAAADVRADLETMRGYDLRLATVAYRLTTANAALCRDLVPTPGWTIHALGQYDPKLRPDIKAVFGFAVPVAVEAVVPGAPAAAAGVVANDGLFAVAGRPIAATDPSKKAATAATRDAVTSLVASQPADRPLVVEIVDAAGKRMMTIPASPGCRTAFEVLIGAGLDASADGDIVQIGQAFLDRFTDDDVAVVVAHELAHNILRHRVRLDAANVQRGLLQEFGRNARLFRITEDQADQLGVALLRNAGYDPAIAVTFWREKGGQVGVDGLLRSRTHGSSKARAAAIAAEIATIPADAPRPYLPPVLAERDKWLQ